MTTETLTFERYIHVPPSAVYYALTNSTALGEWLVDEARADARPGGRLYLWSNEGMTINDKFVTLERDQRVVFTWMASSVVEISLAAQNNGTLLQLSHKNYESQWGQPPWSDSLENLQSVLETGLDLRFYNRPMLGIIGGTEITPELAAEHNLPVSSGLQLQQFVPEMGAAAAGLQRGDILVKLAESEIVAFRSLRPAVNPYKAGDVVEIVFYRGAERMTAQMKLSGRPRPQVPDNAADLAQAARETYARIDGELAELFDGVSEEAAGRSPKAGEWSAKQVVGHLITSEMAVQAWIATLISGDEVSNWASNTWAWVDAILAINPTVPSLLAELSRCEQQTVALLGNLPADFISRKSSYLRAASIPLTVMPNHARTHCGQIRQALEAAG